MKQDATTPHTYLTRLEAEGFLRANGFPVSAKTLQKMATVGGGPIYQRFGHRALYTPDNLLAWARNRLSSPRCNTSEA